MPRMGKVFAAPDVKERLAAMGAQAQLMEPRAFDAYVHQEIDCWAKVVKAAGAKIQ